MKKKIISAIIIALIISVSGLTGVADAKQPFEVEAPAALLIDSATGTVMYQKNPDKKLPLASVTKIMTLCIIFDEIESGRLKYSDKIVMSEKAAKVGGSHVFSDPGYEYEADELIKAVIVASANDGCTAFAEHIAGTEEVFVERMNKKAQQLGMKNTHFVNCTGMPVADHYSSARDISIMSRELIKHKDFSRWSNIWMDKITHKDGRETGLTNTNRLVRFYDGCDGIKTGSTSEAKFCISASATKNGMRLIAIILGAPTSDTRFEEAKKLLNYGFANYESKKLAKSGEAVENEIKLTGAQGSTLKTVIGSDFDLLLKRGEEGNIEKVIKLPQAVKAPLKKGQTVGHIIFKKNGKEIGRAGIVSAENVESAGFTDYLKKIIRYWLGRH